MRGLEYKGDEYNFSPEEISDVIIEDDLRYKHKTVRINYTTYDLRREEETINAKNHADIMKARTPTHIGTPGSLAFTTSTRCEQVMKTPNNTTFCGYIGLPVTREQRQAGRRADCAVLSFSIRKIMRLASLIRNTSFGACTSSVS